MEEEKSKARNQRKQDLLIFTAAALTLAFGGVAVGCRAFESEPEPPPADAPLVAVDAKPLEDTAWRLVEFQSMDDSIGTIKPDDPAAFTMRLDGDGTVTMQLGCNRATGSWSVEPGADGQSGGFEFGPLAATRALCPPPSMDERISRDSEYVRGYLLRDGRLYLSLMGDAGIYAWEPDIQATDLGTCAVANTAPPAVAEALDNYLISLVDPDGVKASFTGYAPGGVLDVTGPDWRYVKAIGWQDRDLTVPVDCAMPFQIGSNTKMMTGVVLLQLQEEGVLSLADPLSAYLPETAAALPGGEDMTLRQLATHTAGAFNYTDNPPDGTPGVMEGGLSDPAQLSRGYEPQELVDFAIAHGQPYFEPGADNSWHYSNTGYALLGQIIEKVTGAGLAQLFEERIFEPLGMEDTFLWNDVPSRELGLASSYFAAPFDIEATAWNMSQGWAAGAVISTPEDMIAFMDGLLGGALFAEAETLRTMQETVPTGNPVIPEYGIGLIEKLPGVWGHGGQTLGFQSDVARFANENITLVVWTNAANSGAGIGVLSVRNALQIGGALPE